MSEVHESDLTENYDLLKEYLLAFAGSKLPSAKDQKASWQHPQASMWLMNNSPALPLNGLKLTQD